MLREGVEDFSRHKSDEEVNSTTAKVIRNNIEQNLSWADIKVGDLVIVKENEAFCADIIILGSSIESGAVYIETSSLDGEKNLKPRSAIKET